MWLILLSILGLTVSVTKEECNYSINGNDVTAIIELFKTLMSTDRRTLLFTEDTLFIYWNVTYNEKQRILEVQNFTCNSIDNFIDPSKLKGVHTLIALENLSARYFMAIWALSESSSRPKYVIFKESSPNRYIKVDDSGYEHMKKHLNSMGDSGIRELRAIANVYNQTKKYLVVYRRQEEDLETGMNVLLHENQILSRAPNSFHRRYNRDCVVVAATGVYTQTSKNFYGIEIYENRFVLRRFFTQKLKKISDCVNGLVIEGSISELIGRFPDPCKGSKLDEIIPFGKWKAVMFGRWMYRTQTSIRIRDRKWERMSWYYPPNAYGVKYDLNRIQWGTFVDAAFYWNKEEETYIFFLDEYFIMKSINDHGSERRNITDKFKINIDPGERITAAFFDNKKDEAYLISGKKYWIVPMEQSNSEKIFSKSTVYLFGKERNVDAVDVDDQYYYFFDGNEHFTFEKNTLQEGVFRAAASVNMKNRDNIFLCYTALDPFHSRLTKWIISGLILMLFVAFLLTCFVFNWPGKTLPIDVITSQTSKQ